MKRTLMHSLVACLAASIGLGPGVAVGDENLPLPPPELARRLAFDDFTILEADDAGGGVMGARKLRLRFPTEPALVEAKWKATGAGADGWNNSPRREIAAYAIQTMFLEVDEYVVPPAAARCVPLAAYAVVDEEAEPTIEGTRCVFGALSAWLSNVEEPDEAFDRERFETDSNYAASFANLNLLHHLIDHRDARGNNFLISKDPFHPRLYSIDNGIAFGGVLWNFFTWHFDEIRVPHLPRDSIDRLRHVSRSELDWLGVVAQLEVDAGGVLQNTAPGANLDPDKGVRTAPWGLQLGLTREEIDALAERLRALIAKVDAGEVQLR